jgi:hypothetical protein
VPGSVKVAVTLIVVPTGTGPFSGVALVPETTSTKSDGVIVGGTLVTWTVAVYSEMPRASRGTSLDLVYGRGEDPARIV